MTFNFRTASRGFCSSARAPLSAALAALALVGGTASAQATWEPTAPVELVVPAGTGGGADLMARFIAETVRKHGLMKQPIQVVNRAGQSGGEGLLLMKAERGNPHKLIITLSNLFTAPFGHALPFSWRDLTPVQLLALDQFVLWVPASSPHHTPQDLFTAIRASPAGSVKLGGTGSKQEDQIIAVLLETALATRINYVALRGGGDVAKALAANEVDLTVNNPIEAEALWRAGKVRPLCVFDGARLPYPGKVAGPLGWSDLPTCMSSGVPVQYLMMRGIFTTGGATPAQVAYYQHLLDRLRSLPEWEALMKQGAFKNSPMVGEAFTNWLDRSEHFHKVLMREARLTPGGTAAAASAPVAQPRRPPAP
ncbi:MAG: tripartite tricarboxylate transporter substrate binding protein [Burkholderiales bacterium]|nr:tripartite tricarboxylate transporter substrate binding protein [Burkholderiales bacterium]